MVGALKINVAPTGNPPIYLTIPRGAIELNELNDVTLDSLTDDELLFSSSGIFINRTKAEADIAAASITLTAGTGLDGGGDLTANRTFELNAASIASLLLADSAAQSGNNISIFNNDAGYITATLTTEEVQDIAGAMTTGNTETLITVTYQDGDGTIDYVVDNNLANYDNSSSGFITATLTDEEVQDIAGAMVTGNTETGITVTYQDGDGTIDYVVNGLTVTEFASAAISQWTNDSNYAADQNLWATISSDSGSTVASTTTDTLTIAGGDDIETSISGDTLTISRSGTFADIPAATFYDNTGGVTHDTTHVNVLNLDTTLTNNATGVYSLAADVVTIGEAADYLITYEASADMAVGTRSGFELKLQKNSVDVDGSLCYGYARLTTEAVATASGSVVVSAAVSDTFRLSLAGLSLSVDTIADGSRLTFVQLKGARGRDGFTGIIEEPDDKDYNLVLRAPYAGEISKVTTQSSSGTCTLTIEINGTPLGGTANSVSTTETDQDHTTANTFVEGDTITWAVSSNSNCDDLAYTLKVI